MSARISKILPILLVVILLAGCSAPSATLDLITVARKGITSAQEAEQANHALLVQRLEAQKSSLDVAFDADVRLAAAGQIKDNAGRPVALTPEWVISARKGYAAARDLTDKQIRSAQTAHATRMDNLRAADESLDMASQLILRQWSVSEKIRQHLINLQRRLTHGQ